MSVHTPLLVAGTLLVLVGGAAAGTGATVLAVAGTDSSVSSGALSVASPGSAVVTAVGDLDAQGGLGLEVSLRFTARADEPVFLGVASAADVDRYLAGAATDTVEDVEIRPLRLTTEHREGSARPEPPGDQSFWLEQSGGGTTGAVTWPVQDGRHRVVVMNADGSSGVDARVITTVHVPHLAEVASGLVVGGLASLGAGVLVLLRARRRPPVGPLTDPGDDSIPVEDDARHDSPVSTP